MKFRNFHAIHLLGCFLFYPFISCNNEVAKDTPRENEKKSEAKVLSREASAGSQLLTDGSQYEGEMLSGLPNGHGNKSFVNGDDYEGQFRKGLRHGHGTHRYKADDLLERYVGMWSNDEWDGYGKLVLKDGSRVVGKWNRSRLNYGDYEGSDGEVRSGKWAGNWDMLNEGFFKNSYGTEFSGIFNQQGEYDNGYIKKPNGDRYIGEFYNNAYHGKGILEKLDGTLYVGDFSQNVYDGVGVLKENDGSVYSGQFVEGLPHGYGIQKDTSGVGYTGNWINGLKDGIGTIDFGDGSSFVGQFSDGLAVDGQYDWGDGRISNAYQDENGNWLDR